jgi:hypothetical protein
VVSGGHFFVWLESEEWMSGCGDLLVILPCIAMQFY